MWFWKKGRKVEISDFYGKSFKLLEYLILNDFIINNRFNIVVFNNDTYEMEEYNKMEHEDFYKLKKLNEEEIIKFHKKYKKVLLEQEMIDELKYLFEIKLIKITDK